MKFIGVKIINMGTVIVFKLKWTGFIYIMYIIKGAKEKPKDETFCCAHTMEFH
jgi:hypothetical protein